MQTCQHSKKHSCGKDEDILEEVTPTKNFVVKGLPDTSGNMGYTEDKVLDVPLRLEGNMLNSL